MSKASRLKPSSMCNTDTLSLRESRPVLVLIPCNQPRPPEDKSVGNAALDRIFAMLGARRVGK